MWEIGGQKLWEVGDWGSKNVGGGRLGVKNCGRWEIGGQNMWEVGDWHPCVTPLLQGRLAKRYISWFHSHLNELRLVDSTKLDLYCRVKKNYVYENYLNCKQHKYIPKFRLSDHWLPIEIGRYQRPNLSREDRIAQCVTPILVLKSMPCLIALTLNFIT